MPRFLPLFALFFAAVAAVSPASGQAVLPDGVAPVEFGRDTMLIKTDKGTFAYNVEVAITRDQQARGLMWRPVLGPNNGMLFIMNKERNVSFWMQNTLIPLDIVFIDNNGKLVSIQRDAQPLSRTTLPSNGPARFVLEIDGGVAAAINISDTTVFEFGAATLDYLATMPEPYGG